MKLAKVSLIALLAMTAPFAQAAVKGYDVHYQAAVVNDDGLTHFSRLQNYGFRMEIVSDLEGLKPESSKDGYPYISAARDERYSVRLYNPLPVRVAVNLTVDGLNAITGQPSGMEDGQKWMIDPYSSITIPGWQVSGGEARRFFFTGKHRSYAKWRGDRMGKDLAANCGVIGAAYFWNQGELDAYYDAHPQYSYHNTHRPLALEGYRAERDEKSLEAPACESMAVPQCPMGAPERAVKVHKSKEQAGTGMGERESNPTIQVAFTYDTGMYQPSQAVVIFYGFVERPIPNPFPAVSYAPEMP